jgi:single-strand DNA-binding protein
MSEGLNKVILLGNLGSNPELRMTNSGTGVLNIRLATTETYLDANKQRQERTEWHRVVLFGKRSEALGKILTKGDRILVEGGLRTTSYDDKDGNKKYTTEIVANNVVLNGSGKGGERSGGGGGNSYNQNTNDDPNDDNIPFISLWERKRYVDGI